MRNLPALGHHVRVPFFTAVMASDDGTWRARDVDVEDAADLDDLAATLRAAAHHDQPVLAVIEAEDQWFALVRVDDDEGARIFVSDLSSASAGHYGPIVSSAAEVDVDVPSGTGAAVTAGAPRAAESAAGSGAWSDATGPAGDGDADDLDDLDDGVVTGTADDDLDVDLIELPTEDETPPVTWAGDPTLLEDFGVTARNMVDMVEENPDDPSTVLADLGEHVGFAELIEALR